MAHGTDTHCRHASVLSQPREADLQTWLQGCLGVSARGNGNRHSPPALSLALSHSSPGWAMTKASSRVAADGGWDLVLRSNLVWA